MKGMERFVHDENIALYRKLIAESEHDPSRDEVRHKMLLTLLADELAKHRKPRGGHTLAEVFPTLLVIATVLA
jgi:hypothetical protein